MGDISERMRRFQRVTRVVLMFGYWTDRGLAKPTHEDHMQKQNKAQSPRLMLLRSCLQCQLVFAHVVLVKASFNLKNCT